MEDTQQEAKKFIRTTISLPREEHKRLRILLLKEGKTLSSWLQEKMKEKLTEEGK